MVKLCKNKQRAVQRDFQKVSCKLEDLVEQLQVGHLRIVKAKDQAAISKDIRHSIVCNI